MSYKVKDSWQLMCAYCWIDLSIAPCPKNGSSSGEKQKTLLNGYVDLVAKYCCSKIGWLGPRRIELKANNGIWLSCSTLSYLLMPANRQQAEEKWHLTDSPLSAHFKNQNQVQMQLNSKDCYFKAALFRNISLEHSPRKTKNSRNCLCSTSISSHLHLPSTPTSNNSAYSPL